jgi:membrane protein YdbS with pleckstrin-like domain
MLKEVSVVNRPDVSKAVTWAYGALVVFIAAVVAFFICAAFCTPMGNMGIVAAVGSAVVELIMLSIVRSLYCTRYILTKEELVIKTTRLIGGDKRIPLNTVESVEKTLMPFGVRLFGASFHGGYCWFPNLGRAFVAMTNFSDGLLIRTNQGNYIITPKNPIDFKEAMEKEISS